MALGYTYCFTHRCGAARAQIQHLQFFFFFGVAQRATGTTKRGGGFGILGAYCRIKGMHFSSYSQAWSFEDGLQSYGLVHIQGVWSYHLRARYQIMLSRITMYNFTAESNRSSSLNYSLTLVVTRKSLDPDIFFQQLAIVQNPQSLDHVLLPSYVSGIQKVRCGIYHVHPRLLRISLSFWECSPVNVSQASNRKN